MDVLVTSKSWPHTRRIDDTLLHLIFAGPIFDYTFHNIWSHQSHAVISNLQPMAT